MGERIAFVSGKGGVGKTLIVSNLGIALAKYGKKVVVVDADLAMGNVDTFLGMKNKPITLQNVLVGEADIKDAMYPVAENLRFIPAGLSIEVFKEIKPERVSAAVDAIEGDADYILIDCPTGAGREMLGALAAGKSCIIVTNPSTQSVTNALKVKILAQGLGIGVIGALVNCVRKEKGEISLSDMKSLLELEILEAIPYDNNAYLSSLLGRPLLGNFPDSEASLKILELAQIITGERKPLEIKKSGEGSGVFGLFGKLFAKLPFKKR